MLIRQIKKDGRLPPEKMSTLTAVLFIPTIIIFALTFKWISGWRADIQHQKNQIEIKAFVESVYKPLATSQKSIVSNLSEMRSLLIETDNMGLDHPNHIKLIQHVKDQWQKGHGVLYDVYTDTDKEVRRAWIAHNTMDREDVLGKFSKQAVQLEVQIKKAEKVYQSSIYSVQGEMIKTLDRARRLLDANRKPAKLRKQRKANQTLSDAIRPYSSSARVDLIMHLTAIDPRLTDDVKTLQELIRIAGQQIVVLRNHLQNNNDLEKPLTKIILDWKNYEESTQLRLRQVLFAVEAEYVSRKLGLSYKSPAVKAMHKSLLLDIPVIVGKALKQRKIINQSYNINRSTR